MAVGRGYSASCKPHEVDSDREIMSPLLNVALPNRFLSDSRGVVGFRGRNVPGTLPAA